MRNTGTSLPLFWAWAIAIAITVTSLIALITGPASRSPEATCLQSHRSVILVPVMCSKHELCDIPIIADVCERVISPAHAPIPDDPDGN